MAIDSLFAAFLMGYFLLRYKQWLLQGASREFMAMSLKL